MSTEWAAATRRGWFSTTHWSVVLAAGSRQDAHGAAALEGLCRVYWYPLYAYLRRQGCSSPDAQDLVQGFFASLLARQSLRDVAPEKGRFRSFLLAALNHFIADERDRAGRQKRGGGRGLISIDQQAAETRYQVEPADSMDPAKLYERQWVLTLLQQVLMRLEDEFRTAGKAAQFGILEQFLVPAKGVPYAAVASQLGSSEGAVKVAVHRMRQRYSELFREQIAQTVSSPEQLEDEVRHLFAALKS